jgi:hypothetical protein
VVGKSFFCWRHDIRHNDTKHNDTQHIRKKMGHAEYFYLAIRLSVIMLCVILPSAVVLSNFAEFLIAEYRYTECCFAEGHYAVCGYTECYFTEFHKVQTCYAQCHHTDCHLAE